MPKIYMRDARKGNCPYLILLLIAAIILMTGGNAVSQDFAVKAYDADREVLSVNIDPGIYSVMKSTRGTQTLEFPLSPINKVELELEKFEITLPTTKFVLGSPGGDIDVQAPDVTLMRGHVVGQPNSSAFIAFSSRGMGNGMVTLESGTSYILAKTPEECALGWTGVFTISRNMGGVDLPPGVEFCKEITPEGYQPPEPDKDGRPMMGGPYLVKFAIECDQAYCQIFGSSWEARAYVLMVFGMISDIYERDLNIRIRIDYMRLWPDGGEPFGADDIYGFADYWHENENWALYNVIHMLSGRRDMSYGGVGYVSGICYQYYPFSIAGFINGSFARPFGSPNIGNWDIQVSAHEIGHNCGSHHTHDGYDPPIDQCPDGIPSRSTIMSYCHTLVGGLSNTEMRFHRRVQEVIRSEMMSGGCDIFDCNGNNISDALDISGGYSQDTNGNGIPDECEDCDNDGILDPADIAGGEQDFNTNGIPDVCEDDCNGNSLPDTWEIFHDYEPDVNGNYVIDDCEADCNMNGVADFEEIDNGITADWDRDNIPDECQDCNDNSVADILELGFQNDIFIADQIGVIHQFNGVSGYPVQDITAPDIIQPYDIVDGPNRMLYVADYGSDQILKLDPLSGTVSPYGDPGPDTDPTSLIFDDLGGLYVACQGDNTIKYFGGPGYNPIDFVTSGLGGLNDPYGVTFGPDGNLYVSNGDNSVLEYSGTNGSFIGVFVSAGSGGLSWARGLVFDLDGNLLVASAGTNNIKRYDGSTGAFMDTFNSGVLTQVWGLRVKPNGHVFAAEHDDSPTPYIFDFFPDGSYYMSYIRGMNNGLVFPTGFAFVPPSPNDCNQNNILDECDIANGILTDANSDLVPDECVTADADGDGYAEGIDNCPGVYNPLQTDHDHDGFGDACDNCVFTYNEDQLDTDADNIGEICDNCPDDYNPLQGDADGDLIGDACDDCTDSDADGYGDPGYPSNTCPDDNCPSVYNPDQTDTDGDGVGDACNVLDFVFDSIQTNCTRLVVGNNGNFGHEGNDGQPFMGHANLDYADFGECDPMAVVYLYTGSVAVGYQKSGSGYADCAMYGPSKSTFRVTDTGNPMEPTVNAGNYEVFKTGTFTTSDYSVGLDVTFLAPTNPDTCNFIIREIRLYSYDGDSHSDLAIGDIIDWDIPSDDQTSDNTYFFDQSRKLIFLQGTEYYGEPGECQKNDRRCGGNALLGTFLNDIENIDTSSLPAAGVPVQASIYVWPTGGLIPSDLYNLMQVYGFSSGSGAQDYLTLMNYYQHYTINPDDTLHIISILATVQDGTVSDLQASIDKAKYWYKSNFLGGAYMPGDANGDATVNVSDAVYIINYVFVGGLQPQPYESGDANCDTSINVSDAVYIINYVFVGGPQPTYCN